MSNVQLKALDYVETSGKALQAARELAEKTAAKEAAVAEAAPEIANALIESKLIEASEKTAAIAQLSQHDTALTIVGNLLHEMQSQKQAYEQRLAAAGQGKAAASADVPGHTNKIVSADVDLSSGGYIGHRRGAGEKSAADIAFLRSLGRA